MQKQVLFLCLQQIVIIAKFQTEENLKCNNIFKATFFSTFEI